MYIRKGSANTVPNLPQNTGSPSSWDPSTISNVVFGTIMVFVGIVAIWQGRRRRVVVLDEELAIIRPACRSRSSVERQHITSDPAIQVPTPYRILRDTSNVSPSTTQLAIMDGDRSEHGLPLTDDDIVIPKISNRVATLSTIGSVVINNERRSLDITTPELGMPKVDASANIKDGFDHQSEELEQAT